MSIPTRYWRIGLTTIPEAVRNALGSLLAEFDTTQVAWVGGQYSDTPGTAFFCGYQAAMRCVDPSLSPKQWAAFCISEKGLKSLKEMSCQLDEDGRLSGQKSHAMLAGQGLDRLYVVARRATELVCVTVAADAPGLDVLSAGKPQPFMPDLPHLPLSFNRVEAGFYCDDANGKLNKPFRYWEDVHGLLALAGWMLSWLPEEDHPALKRLALALNDAFTQQPAQYHLAALDAFDALFAGLEKASAGLADELRELWQRDRLLLVFTQPLREKIRAKLSAP